jgi:uncharacterized membrane protein YccC
MAERAKAPRFRVSRAAIIHAARTAVAATVSLAIAKLVRLPESYWAAITTLVVMQSTLGAELAVSAQRLLGTALGAILGALLAAFGPATVVVFAVAVFGTGVLCALLGVDRSAYRFASIEIAIISLIVRVAPPWVVAAHRFLEVSAGIVVALAVTAIWPEREAPPA